MGPFVVMVAVMRLFAVLLLMLAIVATGDGFVAPAMAAPAAVERSADGAAEAEAQVLPRFCVGKSGIPTSGAILCQAEKRSPEMQVAVPTPPAAAKRRPWPTPLSGMGTEPGPDLDPPRQKS